MKSIPLTYVDQEIARIQGEIASLKLRLDVLLDIRGKAVDSPTQRASDERQRGLHDATSQGTTTDVIRALVRAEPGISPSEVADRLKDKVKTGSSDPRRAVYNGTINLVTRGDLHRDEAGGLHIKDDASQPLL